MLRAIREIQPRYVVGENVRGLTNWNGGMVFDEVQADLEAEGYEVTPFLLPACGVGSPHRRDRIWFIAYSRSNAVSISIQQRGQIKAGNADVIGKTESGIIANTDSSKRCEGGLYQGEPQTSTGYTGPCHSRNDWKEWQDFPTQSPVCSGNNGFPNGLADITVPSKKYGTRLLKGKQAYGRWRNESITALGNAIVPQVAYQLFKAIDQFQKNSTFMKVELDNITLGLSPLTGNIFAGIPLKTGEWRHKIDVTQSFISCFIQKYEGKTETISGGDNKWEITVKKIK
jgi:DNA (cytosine-5)-methyltransferase 1